MKKLLPFLAIVLAITFSAFTSTSAQKGLTPMYWYDLEDNSLGHGNEPNNGCTKIGEGCAVGFVVDPVEPSLEIPDATRDFN